MTTTHAVRWNRVPLHVAVIAAALAGAAGVAAGSAITRHSDRPADPAPAAVDVDVTPAATPIWVQAQQQRDLRRLAEAMPSGWPATEAMLEAADKPLGDAAQRARWLEDAERMPTGWPATEIMRRAASDE
jgi:hypothetical protein